ncbi:hypothetical protein CERSUDRAFT_113801 [Gelatoporia subvermispora B]|uniref:L-serine ammonia-lyase n=1 Tax=Ceriporiopsis subvermispora (strain B) TaxID=914234 RepID=M2QNJ9_CERS8|nr:hypothetical protein CERSUDRAFT_113801 [Gelatoporia subvermispora B]
MTTTANGTTDKPLWLETPLVYSPHISARLDCDVYLKLDNLQRAHSFKSRGISHFVQHAVRTHGPSVHLVIASGGNAGLAAACAAHALNARCTVCLPDGASVSTLDFLRREGAEVVIEGRCYAQALERARKIVEEEPDAVMVPAYDDPLLWEGHASLVHEVSRQLPPGTTPDAIFCSVGGGGLIGGIMQGCKQAGWENVRVVAMETLGSNCLYEALALNPGMFSGTERGPHENVTPVHDEEHDVKVAHLAKLTSQATSLGASAASAGVVKLALQHKGGIKSVCVPDTMAMMAGLHFADEHKILVELACATTLVPAYWGNQELFDKVVPPAQDGRRRVIVFEVCGGFKVSLAEMEKYRKEVEADVQSGKTWDILCNGERWSVQPSI